MTLLELTDVNAYYDTSHILFDVSIEVSRGQSVALIGRNGVGKTTTLRSVMGMTDVREGSITFDGENITNNEPHQISERGIAIVPEKRRIVNGLSVGEHLHLGHLSHDTEHSETELREQVFEIFPRLEERYSQTASTMSGGEKQMLAIGRALMSEPELLLVDEPTEGLMPSYVETIRNVLTDLNEEGLTIVLVEQNVDLALDVSDYGYILAEGKIEAEGTASELKNDQEVINTYISV